jgi:virginiamycin B lyase
MPTIRIVGVAKEGRVRGRVMRKRPPYGVLVALLSAIVWSLSAVAMRITLHRVPQLPTNVYAWQGGVLFTGVTSTSPFTTASLTPQLRLTPGPKSPEGSEGQWIAVGPDGNLWLDGIFVEELPKNEEITRGALYEITAKGVELRFKFPGQWAQPFTPGELVAGPDHALWIADPAGYIERYEPAANALTVYSLPHYGAPVGIIDGPEEALWFTDLTRGAIGRVTTSGEISERLIEDGRTQFDRSYTSPNSLVEGADHAIWFTEWDRIGRMTPTGELSEFAIPNAHGIAPGLAGAPMPRSVTAAPDGSIYFTDVGDSAIGRVLPDGEVTEFPVETAMGLASSPNRIARGPEGKLWFTETGEMVIGSVDPDAEPLPSVSDAPATHKASKRPRRTHRHCAAGRRGRRKRSCRRRRTALRRAHAQRALRDSNSRPSVP